MELLQDSSKSIHLDAKGNKHLETLKLFIMRIRKKKLLLTIIIAFIFFVSYKILEPEIRGDNFKELESAELAKLNVKHHIEGKQDFKKHQHGEETDLRKEDVIQELIKKYRVNYNRPLKESPWALAERWVSASEIHPEYTPELGAVLRSMAKRKIISADVGYKGTQLKMALVLEGGQRAVFKPKWFPRTEVIEGLYAGADRHNGEITAYHLGRILEFRRTPHVVGRYINLDTEIKPIAKQRLLETFFTRNNNTCFYGKCLYCKGEHTGVCAEGRVLEGAVLLWLPQTLTLDRHKHPWARIYKTQDLAKWQTDEGYCNNTVLKMEPYRSGRLLLDIIDTAVFDYLIGNADRHMFETLHTTDVYSMMLILDNGKSFGNPHHDEKSILAPLYQCCRIRTNTMYRLLVLQDGILSEVLNSVLSQDPIAPVITDLHLQAIDRRLKYVIVVIKDCIQKMGSHNVLFHGS